MDESAKTEIQEAIKAVRDTLESEDAAEIRAKTEALQAAFHKVSEAMYQKAQQEQAAAAADGSPNGAGDGATARARRRRRSSTPRSWTRASPQ